MAEEEYDSNHNGKSAERRVITLLEQLGVPLNVAHLDAKWPVIDFYVQFERGKKSYYFFIQVKNTYTGIEGKNGKQRLGITLKKKDHQRLATFEGPTYVFGVDLSGGGLSYDEDPPKVFIRTIRGNGNSTITSITATDRTDLNHMNLKKLIEEVMEYWDAKSRSKNKHKSNFDKK